MSKEFNTHAEVVAAMREKYNDDLVEITRLELAGQKHQAYALKCRLYSIFKTKNGKFVIA